MAVTASPGRANQRRRARKDLLEATARLLKQGRKPSLQEVAEEALVSRATAYRYFPSIEALLAEASVDVAVPKAGDLFDDRSTKDPIARLRRVDDALYATILENEVPLRMMLAHSVELRARGGDAEVPVRQNRRTLLIEAALEPVRERLPPVRYDALVAALALIVGTESMVVFKDVLQLDHTRARKVRHWAIGALVEAALKR